MPLPLAQVALHSKNRRFDLLHHLFVLLSTARQRSRLARLDDHLLRDIGLTRAEAEAEARRPYWDAPDHWISSGPKQG